MRNKSCPERRRCEKIKLKDIILQKKKVMEAEEEEEKK